MANARNIIGLHSPAPQSGKSTVAQALAERDGHVCLSIAGGIRDLARLMGMGLAADAGNDTKDVPHPALGGRSPREVLIRIGNAMRTKHGPGYWVDALMTKIAALPADIHTVVIDDVRTQLEGDTVHGAGGIVVTIVRSSATPNPNDVGGYEPQVTVSNDGTIDECIQQVDAQIQQFFNRAEAA